MKEIPIKDEYIKLDQFLKFVNLVSSGIEAKMIIKDGQVKVNGEVELRRGKKLHDGDQVEFEGNFYCPGVIHVDFFCRRLCHCGGHSVHSGHGGRCGGACRFFCPVCSFRSYHALSAQKGCDHV